MTGAEPGRGGEVFIKIVFILTRADDLGGAQLHVRDLAAALSGKGEDVTVLAGGSSESILFWQLAGMNVNYRRIAFLVHPIRIWADTAACLEIRSVLKELRPDLVTTHSNKAGLLGRIAARSLGIPVIHTSHGFIFSEKPESLTGLFYRLMEKFAARLGSKVIAVAQSEFSLAEKYRVISAQKMVVIHNGLPDNDDYKLSLPAREPAGLVMVARFVKPKDHLTLIRALSKLKDLPWALTLVGDGPGQAGAKRLAAELGIENNITYAGQQTDVPAVLSAAQIFVLSSAREGFPLSILEAMRAGLPVVAAAVGGISEAVIDGKTGFLFPAGDADRLQEQLARLIGDPPLRAAMGTAGRERFLQYFTLEKMLEKTMAAYRSALP